MNLIRKNLRFTLKAIAIFSLLMQTACVKDHFDFDKVSKTVDYSPQVAAALAHTKLTARDIIRDYDDDELFEETADGFLYLMYDERVYSVRADQFISLPDQNNFPTMNQYNKTTYDVAPVVSGYHEFPEVPVLYDFIVDNNEQLDSVVFDALDIEITVNSSFHVEGILNLTFPAFQKNGQAFTSVVYPDNSGNYTYNLTTHLEDYRLIFDANRVLVNFNLKLIDGTVASGEELSINIKMKNMDFQSIYGYVGQHAINIPKDTVHIDIFDKAFNGQVYFHDPSLTITMTNFLGLPISIAFDSLYTYSNIIGDFNGYRYPGSNPLDINRPSNEGESANTQEYFNVQDFPELRQIVAESPKYVFFDVNGIVNPNGYVASPPNFVNDSSRFNVNMELKLPLEGNAVYSFVDTVALDIESNYEDIAKYFVEAEFRTVFDCFMPTNAYAQVIFTDSLYIPIDTLYKTTQIGERLINSAVLNNEGRAITPVRTITDIVFGNGPQYEHDINNLERVKYAVIIATVQTNLQNQVGQAFPLVKFYSDNYIEVKFGLKGQGRYQEPLD
ncbi:MAG: hypothetical protein JXR60_00040 [Bacteroidales bacterium]|nr:hypothetical protein [Bacteroidales bacterium]